MKPIDFAGYRCHHKWPEADRCGVFLTDGAIFSSYFFFIIPAWSEIRQDSEPTAPRKHPTLSWWSQPTHCEPTWYGNLSLKREKPNLTV